MSSSASTPTSHTHSAAVVDTATGGVLDEITVEATAEGYAELVEFANNHAMLAAPRSMPPPRLSCRSSAWSSPRPNPSESGSAARSLP